MTNLEPINPNTIPEQKKGSGCFSTLFIIVIIVCVGLLSYRYRSWIFDQVRHVTAFYYIWQGDYKYRQDKLQDAINNYEIALKLYPEHVRGQYNLGNIYVIYEDYYKAVEHYEKALDANPNYINARINLGIILSEEILDVDRAIDEYQRAINAQPILSKIPVVRDIFSTKESLAVAYYNLGLAYKSKAILAAPDSANAKTYLDKAAHSYRESLKLRPEDYDTNYNLAAVNHILGNFTEALRYYCFAINLEPLNYESHYNLAILLNQTKKYKESIKELEKAGYILDSKGEGFKTQYIYQVLNDVSQRSLGYGESKYEIIDGKDKEEKVHDKYKELSYKNGKVIIADEREETILENFKACNSCKAVEAFSRK